MLFSDLGEYSVSTQIDGGMTVTIVPAAIITNTCDIQVSAHPSASKLRRGKNISLSASKRILLLIAERRQLTAPN
jgi:hypothetical protein